MHNLHCVVDLKHNDMHMCAGISAGFGGKLVRHFLRYRELDILPRLRAACFVEGQHAIRKDDTRDILSFYRRKVGDSMA